MDLMIALPLATLFLLSLIYTIIGYVKESTYSLGTTVFEELLIVGAAFALLCIIVLVGKMC